MCLIFLIKNRKKKTKTILEEIEIVVEKLEEKEGGKKEIYKIHT